MARVALERADRRADITKALYDCIKKKGYANTSLKEIAEQAGMSPSHVGYYFDDQASVLEYYTIRLAERIVTGFPHLGEPDPAKLADTIATFCFGAGQVNTEFLGVIQEIDGLAVHDARLHQIKTEHAMTWRKYLEAFFEKVPPAAGLTSRQAAWLAHALLVGLQTNSLFDRSLGCEATHELFRRALRALGGLKPGNFTGPTAVRPQSRRLPPAKRRGRRGGNLTAR